MSSDAKPAAKSGIWGALKGAMFEETPEQPAAEPVAPVPRPTGAYQAPPMPVRPYLPPVNASVSVDPAVIAELEKVLATKGAKNYLDFVEQLQTLSAVIPDEAACYRAALALLGKKGVSPAQMVEDFTISAQVLATHNEKFHQQCEQQIAKNVGGRAQAVTDLDTRIASLQNEIAQLTQQRNEQANGIEAEQRQITELAQRYTAAFDALMGQLGERKSKIQMYGRGG